MEENILKVLLLGKDIEHTYILFDSIGHIIIETNSLVAIEDNLNAAKHNIARFMQDLNYRGFARLKDWTCLDMTKLLPNWHKVC